MGEALTFAGNAQHTGVFEPPATYPHAIRWSTTIDRRQTFNNTHYGSPLATAANTLIVPVKTEGDGFQIKMFDGRTGEQNGERLTPTTCCHRTTGFPSSNWYRRPCGIPPPVRCGSAASTMRGWRNAFLRHQSGSPGKRPADPRCVLRSGRVRPHMAAFTSSVFVNTPLTADSVGNGNMGFRVQGSAPAPLSTTQSGFARITAGRERHLRPGRTPPPPTSRSTRDRTTPRRRSEPAMIARLMSSSNNGTEGQWLSRGSRHGDPGDQVQGAPQGSAERPCRRCGHSRSQHRVADGRSGRRRLLRRLRQHLHGLARLAVALQRQPGGGEDPGRLWVGPDAVHRAGEHGALVHRIVAVFDLFEVQQLRRGLPRPATA